MAYLGALVAVARADGDLGHDERGWIRRVAAERFAFEPDDETLFFSDVLWNEACGARPRDQLARALVDDAVALAHVDGAVGEAEVRAIEKVAEQIGIAADEVAAALTRHVVR